MYKTKRYARIVISLEEQDEYDAFDIGEALMSLPEGTKVIRTANSDWDASLGIIVQNNDFNGVEEADLYPTLKISETEDEHLVIDCSSILTADAFRKQLENTTTETIDNHLFNTTGKIQKRKGFLGIENNKLETFIYDIDTGKLIDIPNSHFVDYDEKQGAYQKYVIKNLNHNWLMHCSWDKGTEITKNKSQCNHQWKHYEGITATYNYCEKCNQKE